VTSSGNRLLRAFVLGEGKDHEVSEAHLADIGKALQAYEVTYLIANHPPAAMSEMLESRGAVITELVPEPGLLSILSINYLVLTGASLSSHAQWIELAKAEGVDIMCLY
jgi:hypothetical protein